MKTLTTHITVLFLFIFASQGFAQKDPELRIDTKFEDLTVNHVIFNSTFVLPKVARAYNIKRSKNESLLNVSVIANDKAGAIPVRISGTATNLMQQQKTLKFKEITEDGVTYYLAPIRVGNEELLRFRLKISTLDGKKNYDVSFKQTVYADK